MTMKTLKNLFNSFASMSDFSAMVIFTWLTFGAIALGFFFMDVEKTAYHYTAIGAILLAPVVITVTYIEEIIRTYQENK